MSTVNLKFRVLMFLPQLGMPCLLAFERGLCSQLCASAKQSLNLLSLFERTFKAVLDRQRECWHRVYFRKSV